MTHGDLFAPPAPFAPPSCAFTVPGEPVPCGRPRARIVTPRGGKPFVQMYAAPESDAYEKLVGQHALVARPAAWRQHWAAYELRIRVYQRERRGDWDNFAKAVADGCQGVLWQNDRRIRMGRVDMLDDLANPRLEVFASMVGALDAEADRRARAKALASAQRRRTQ